jgi:hypothetical protein
MKGESPMDREREESDPGTHQVLREKPVQKTPRLPETRKHQGKSAGGLRQLQKTKAVIRKEVRKECASEIRHLENERSQERWSSRKR